MKRTLIALLAVTALTLPAMAQSGQRDTPRYSDERTGPIRGKIIGSGDRDFDRRRGGMRRDFDRRYSMDRGRHRGHEFGRFYRERYGERTARNRTYGERGSRY
jgi:hypothetical protein